MSAGKVGNLRAMFEQRGESSPPERGRSPGIPAAKGDWESPRPRSKIRASFVAVEKEARIGVPQPPNSRDSSVSARRLSDATTTSAPVPDSFHARAESMEATVARSNLKDQPIPESPRADHGGADLDPGTAAPQAGGTANGHVSTGHVASPLSKSDSDGKTSKPNGIEKPKLSNGKSTSAKAAPKATEMPVATKTASTTEPSSTAGKTTGAKTQATPSPPKLANHAKPTDKKPTTTSPHTDKSTASKPMSTTHATSSAAPVKKPPPLLCSPSSGTGFVKPKVKSPTRPVKLPVGLTMHTAASGSKVNGAPPGQPASRAATAHSDGHSFSRANASATATARTNLKGHVSTTAGRPRPSLGLPPKQAAKEHPPVRKEKEVDEGFLSRMMRPTQSSSSKSNDKAQDTPPKKLAPYPATKHVAPRPVANKVKPKLVEKATKAAPFSASATVSLGQPLEHKNEAKPDQEKHQSSANKAAVVVEQAVTAEQAVAVAKEVEGEMSVTPEPKAELVTEMSETPHIPVAQGSDEEVNQVQETESKEAATDPVSKEHEAPSAHDTGDQAEVTRPKQSVENASPEPERAKNVNGGLEQRLPDEGETKPAFCEVVENDAIHPLAEQETGHAEDQDADRQKGVPAVGA